MWIMAAKSWSRLRVGGSSRAWFTASASLSTIVWGVPFGANIAFQPEAWNSGSPASIVVGTWEKSGRTLRRRDGEELDVAGLHLGHSVGDLIAHEVELAGDEVAQGGSRSAIRDLDRLNPDQGLEQQAAHMGGRPGAGVPLVQLVGMGPQLPNDQ